MGWRCGPALLGETPRSPHAALRLSSAPASLWDSRRPCSACCSLASGGSGLSPLWSPGRCSLSVRAVYPGEAKAVGTCREVGGAGWRKGGRRRSDLREGGQGSGKEGSSPQERQVCGGEGKGFHVRLGGRVKTGSQTELGLKKWEEGGRPCPRRASGSWRRERERD